MTTVVERPTGWTADASAFGARLALIRQRMGWGNIERAAKACGVPAETWRSWERDNREPHRMTTVAKQIASATGCDYLWLVHGPDRGEGGVKETYDPVRVLTGRSPVPRRRPVIDRPVSAAPANRRARDVRSPSRRERESAA